MRGCKRQGIRHPAGPPAARGPMISGVRTMTVIATNNTANSALLYLNKNSASQSNDLSQLASGSKITSAKDDASGLAVANGMASDAAVLQLPESGNAIAVSIDGNGRKVACEPFRQ